jgi:hypothetical protein
MIGPVWFINNEPLDSVAIIPEENGGVHSLNHKPGGQMVWKRISLSRRIEFHL